jgi:hypothetical protein
MDNMSTNVIIFPLLLLHINSNSFPKCRPSEEAELTTLRRNKEREGENEEGIIKNIIMDWAGAER